MIGTYMQPLWLHMLDADLYGSQVYSTIAIVVISLPHPDLGSKM